MTRPNAPAFATGVYDDDHPATEYTGTVGLTVREHFAALALQGILAAEGRYIGASAVAQAAVEHADALIAALNSSTDA